MSNKPVSEWTCGEWVFAGLVCLVMFIIGVIAIMGGVI